MNRSLVFDLATANWVGKREDALFLGPPWQRQKLLRTSHRTRRHPAGLPRVVSRSTQAVGRTGRRHARWQTQGVDGAADHRAATDRRRPGNAQTAADRCRGTVRDHHAPLRTSEHTPNVQQTGRRLGKTARRKLPAVTAMLDRLLHHGHVLKCGPRSWRTKTGSAGDAQ